MKEETQTKRDQPVKQTEEHPTPLLPLPKGIERFLSPIKETCTPTKKSISGRLNTPIKMINSSGSKVDSKILFTPSKTTKKKWKICIGGFSNQTREFNKNVILDLGGDYLDNISPEIDVFVAFKAFSMKTKVHSYLLTKISIQFNV